MARLCGVTENVVTTSYMVKKPTIFLEVADHFETRSHTGIPFIEVINIVYVTQFLKGDQVKCLNIAAALIMGAVPFLNKSRSAVETERLGTIELNETRFYGEYFTTLIGLSELV